MTTPTDAPICDYEHSGYATDFWEGKGRDYEDAVERLALRQLLPAHAQRCAEFGAGFGRLTDEWARYAQIVLIDYSRSLLEQAQAQHGRSDKYIYVAADLHHLPFATNAFDVATLIRVIHHIPDPHNVLAEIRGTLAPDATFILEFANKRNLKAIARYLLRRQTWSPFDKTPVEFVKLNFDFHPAAMRALLLETGFEPGRTLAVSMLRIAFLKRHLPIRLLTTLDHVIQPSGAIMPLSPSVFVRNHVGGTPSHPPLVPIVGLFVNPMLKTSVLKRDGETLVCPQSGARWSFRDGIYDFKATM